MENNIKRKQTGNGPGDVESDSGDSLFLTQKPVPEALRSGRPYLVSQRSTPISHRFVEDSGSSSESESENVPGRRKKLQPLPKYNFPFLKPRKRGPSYISSQSNKILHYYAIGGFFNSVRELSSHGQKRKSNKPLLPAEDEAEDITPLTEEEMSDEEDIKIVSKKMLVYSLQPNRTKSSHLNPKKKKDLGKVTSEKDSAKKKTYNNNFDLWRNHTNQHHSVDSCDSDATLIEEPRSIAQKYVSENLTELQQSASPVSVLCPTEELNPESQSILQNITADITEQIHDRTCKEKRLKTKKKRKPKDVVLGDETDHQDKLVNDESQESGVLLEDHSTKSPPGVLHYDNIHRKKTNKCIAISGRLHNQPENLSCNVENVASGQKLNEDFEIPSSSLVETLNSDDSTIRKKKKKQKKKKSEENVEIETGRELDPGQILNNVQLDNSNTDNLQVHEEVSELTNDVSPKKHKKRLKLHKTSLSKTVESHEHPELVDLKSIATDSITTQSDESASVRKKRKKKRRGSVVGAETVETSHLLVSQSVDGDIADTNQTESAGNGGQLYEPVLELGNSVTRKKKKHRHDSTGVFNNGSDKPDALGQNTKATEGTTISGKNKCTRNQSEECDSAEVAHPQSDECEQLKKKKKKSKRSHQAEISNVQQMSPSEEEGTTIKSLNAFENQVTKKKKRKLHDDDDDVDEGKSVEKSELEQSTVKRKKLKEDRIKHNPDVSIQSYVEMSPSSGRPVKNKSQTKVKKRLYNPNDYLQEF